MQECKKIKAIIGLGNPGPKHAAQRHNIGFMVLDALAERYHADWQVRDVFEVAQLRINDQMVWLIKPQTFMNSSGKVIPWLRKKGIESAEILVVHDELEKPFGHLSLKFDGSARGHNGLRSIIDVMGKAFHRLRFGIGRPERKDDVGNWVLSGFTEPADQLQLLIDDSVSMIVDLF